jgi:hypothetical protein
MLPELDTCTKLNGIALMWFIQDAAEKWVIIKTIIQTLYLPKYSVWIIIVWAIINTVFELNNYCFYNLPFLCHTLVYTDSSSTAFTIFSEQELE